MWRPPGYRWAQGWGVPGGKPSPLFSTTHKLTAGYTISPVWLYRTLLRLPWSEQPCNHSIRKLCGGGGAAGGGVG